MIDGVHGALADNQGKSLDNVHRVKLILNWGRRLVLLFAMASLITKKRNTLFYFWSSLITDQQRGAGVTRRSCGCGFSPAGR